MMIGPRQARRQLEERSDEDLPTSDEIRAAASRVLRVRAAKGRILSFTCYTLTDLLQITRDCIERDRNYS